MQYHFQDSGHLLLDFELIIGQTAENFCFLQRARRILLNLRIRFQINTLLTLKTCYFSTQCM